MIPIVCITEVLGGQFDTAHRELDNWFERDIEIQGYICTVVYPKNCWKTVTELEVAA